MLNLFGCAGLRLSIHGATDFEAALFGALIPWMLKQVQHDGFFWGLKSFGFDA
jgi:hypothetical protein